MTSEASVLPFKLTRDEVVCAADPKVLPRQPCHSEVDGLRRQRSERPPLPLGCAPLVCDAGVEVFAVTPRRELAPVAFDNRRVHLAPGPVEPSLACAHAVGEVRSTDAGSVGFDTVLSHHARGPLTEDVVV